MTNEKLDAAMAGVVLYRRVGPLRLTDGEMARMTKTTNPDLLRFVRAGFEGARDVHREDSEN